MKKAWLISVNMGYGHQRTAFALRDLAEREIINANDYQGIPGKDKKTWEGIRKFYEFISNFYRIPLIGKLVFGFFDRFQKIFRFYPKRNLFQPNFQLKQTYSLIKKGLGRDLIEKLKAKNEKLKTNLPIISTFFTPAFMAEFFNYPGEIFCVVCDADISRTWAPLNSRDSKIKYFVPTERVLERLKLYGVKKDNIFLTGYPLPIENIGSENLEILKEDLKHRLLNLDPQKKYFEKYKTLIEEHLGKLPEKSDHILTIMFSVGGAGAQKELAIQIVKSLAKEIKNEKIKIILSAGIKKEVKEYFQENIKKLNFGIIPRDMEDKIPIRAKKEISSDLPRLNLGRNVEILYQEKIEDYFEEFNQKLRKTDILWTKPSELSFYSALGIPIIIAPPIGSQEEFNRSWLLKSGFGIFQENPNYTNQWLFDWLEKGYLAEMAMEGFLEGAKLGTLNISRIIREFRPE